MNDSQVPPESADALVRVELEIARRADALARDSRHANRHPLDLWREAEEEVWIRRWHGQSAANRF